MPDPNRFTIQRVLSAGEFRRLALQRALDLLRSLQLKLDSQVGFEARRPATLFRFLTAAEMSDAIDRDLAEIRDRMGSSALLATADGHRKLTFDELKAALDPPLRVLLNLTHGDAGGLLLLDAFNQLLAIEEQFFRADGGPPNDSCRITAEDSHVYFFVDDKGVDRFDSWKEGLAEAQFVASVGQLLQEIRAGRRVPSSAEMAAVQAAYDAVARGVAVATPYRPLGAPGFRKHQTLLFLTDPGEGHLRVTCRRHELFDGTGAAVHVEHIDRDEGGDRERVEPYRLPAAINAARVRLHIGSDAPCTAYVGRPVFENYDRGGKTFDHYALDRLKSAHLTAGACTSLFMNGIAECKVGIERMTAEQAVDFMKAVAGNVFRDRHRQFLSAAFNIFTPIFDDRDADAKRHQWVSDPAEICRLGIDLAVRGRFDKVTWDGANSGEFPSQPVLARMGTHALPQAFWAALVHEAHAVGLTTYVSAGLEPQHVPRAVFAGLDGIGIGVKLHHYDQKKLRMGELVYERMKAVLDAASQAENTALGLAAKALARLDRLSHEGYLPDEYRGHVPRLLQALQAFDPAATNDGNTGEPGRLAREAVEGLSDVLALNDDDNPLAHPLVGKAKRAVWFAGKRKGYESDWLSAELAGIRAELRADELREFDAATRRPGK
jgi:hypothetical protein